MQVDFYTFLKILFKIGVFGKFEHEKYFIKKRFYFGHKLPKFKDQNNFKLARGCALVEIFI